MSIPAVCLFSMAEILPRPSPITGRLPYQPQSSLQLGIPLVGCCQEAVPAIDNGATERIGRGSDRYRPRDSRLEVFQLGLAVGKEIVLQRSDVDLDFRDETLEVQKILQGVSLDAVSMRAPRALGFQKADDAQNDLRIVA